MIIISNKFINKFINKVSDDRCELLPYLFPSNLKNDSLEKCKNFLQRISSIKIEKFQSFDSPENLKKFLKELNEAKVMIVEEKDIEEGVRLRELNFLTKPSDLNVPIPTELSFWDAFKFIFKKFIER